MIKQYQLKLYNQDNTFKLVINDKNITNNINYSSEINGGQGQLSISIKTNFSDSSYEEGDIIKLYEFDNNNEGVLIYSGFITQVRRNISSNDQSITIICVGLCGLLNQIFFNSGGLIFNKTDEPADILKEIIDYANTKYNVFSYDTGSIIDFGSNVSIDFNYTTCFYAIQKLQESTGYWFYIGADGKVYFKPKPISVSHTFKIQFDVDNLTVEENTEELVNTLYLSRAGGTIKTYIDLTSISTYGLKEKTLSKSELADEATQDEYGNNYISVYKNPIRQSNLTVNDKYNIELIRPGDTIKILNSDYIINNLQIVSINYNQNTIKLNLEKFDSFGKTIFK